MSAAHRGPIADADVPLSVYFRTVDEHRRHLAAQHLADDRVTIVQRVDAEAVDDGAADPFSLILARRRGDEQERVAGCLRLAGERAEEFDVVRVGERPLERVREHDANRTGAPAAERARDGIRSAVVEFGRCRQDTGAQLIGQLVRSRESVGDRGSRDPQQIRDRLQCDCRRHVLTRSLRRGYLIDQDLIDSEGLRKIRHGPDARRPV